MAISVDVGHERRFELSVGEVTGAFGDSVTVLPIVVAATALTSLSLSHVLLGFAVFQIVWGVYYGLPVSVEPMKALAALVVAGSLSAAGLVAAGLLAGVVLLAVGTFDLLDRVESYLSAPVIRGVQLAVGLALVQTGVGLAVENLVLAGVAVAVVAVLALADRYRESALVVLLLGAVVALARTGLTPQVPAFSLVSLPPLSGLPVDVLQATVGQLAMTVGNAAVATSLLLSDYFDADVSPDELARSMGLMNLLAVPLGAMPMCHGSGGVAGKYSFGARTAGSNLVLGVTYAVLAVVAAGVVAAFPVAVLGVVLVLVGVQLGRTALESSHLGVTTAVGVVGLLAGVGATFVGATLVDLAVGRLRDRRARG
ncbi:MAG: putative sulfate/molybdate transporter [Haloarculaceae archaeon]